MLRISILLMAFLLACQPEAPSDIILTDPPPPGGAGLKYLALGDSYTIGQSVAEEERFPVQLIAKWKGEGKVIDSLRILAVTGWTTENLKNGLAGANLGNDYDLVSLLIGVNNQYQGRPISEYEQHFDDLLDSAILHAGGDPERVFVLSIPDYAYTPFGQNRPNPAQISAEIDAFNLINKALTEARGIQYYDITPISRLGLEQPELVAGDKLHPSGEQYRRWVELIE